MSIICADGRVMRFHGIAATAFPTVIVGRKTSPEEMSPEEMATSLAFFSVLNGWVFFGPHMLDGGFDGSEQTIYKSVYNIIILEDIATECDTLSNAGGMLPFW